MAKNWMMIFMNWLCCYYLLFLECLPHCSMCYNVTECYECTQGYFLTENAECESMYNLVEPNLWSRMEVICTFHNTRNRFTASNAKTNNILHSLYYYFNAHGLMFYVN